MHDVPTRQLIALSAALLACFTAPCSGSDEPHATTIGERVQAAKLMHEALQASGNPEARRKLEDEYSALADRYPHDVTVINARAEFLWDIGEQSRAVAEWERAERIEPRNPQILERLGESALALGDPRKAAAFFERAVTCDSGNAASHFALANVWFLFRHELTGLRHSDEGSLLHGALGHFAEAARLAPQNADYARAYAETFYSFPKPDWLAALDAWQEVHRLIPEKNFALGHLARTHIQMGHFDASQACLDRILTPEYQNLKSRLQTRIDAARRRPAKAPQSPAPSSGGGAPKIHRNAPLTPPISPPSLGVR